MKTDLLHKYLSGTCSEEEKKEVERWLDESPENQEKMSEIKQIWDISPGKKVKVNSYKAWDEFSERHLGRSETSSKQASGQPTLKKAFKHHPEKKKSAKTVAFSLAAAAVLLIAFLFYSSNPFPVEKPEPALVSQEITTEKGQRTTVRLSDGTRIHLNAESQLTVPQDYMQNDRVVQLNGEAFFEVQSNKERPFVVHTEKSVTRVLGTRFNVTAYPDQEEVQVVVAEGKVALGSDQDLQALEVQLTKNQKGTITSNGEIIASNVSDMGMYLDWSQGRLTFRDAPLEEVEKRLERWFDIEVSVEKSISNHSRLLTGSFEDVPLSSVLNSIALSLDINYKKAGQKITFVEE
ncbi:FecR domain-containing protein [Aliifodinibius sp. S!AR15-10]|uniref:FecR domain-containing protein n=1 Tax=Aliifodinibius sp. S!AR15-10 TaxID=2950437 RepID=UPI0028569882|nr:FecR domain-containing protein [Aliifodinibius sp. S!AR15-10]MDR8393609.1 FecR domain-containing protein [Aliifodinibius sp. S!AR15-10]